jgi:hypothetical protein
MPWAGRSFGFGVVVSHPDFGGVIVGSLVVGIWHHDAVLTVM